MKPCFLPRVLCAIILIALVVWLVLDVSQRREQLVSLGGFFVLLLLLFVCSKHPRAVSAPFPAACECGNL